jgi:hypothetical protein
MHSKHTIITLAIFLWTVSTVAAQPSIIADGPLEFCYPGSITLCVEPEYYSYLWSTGSTEQCITVFESGDYYAIIADSLLNVDSSLVSSPTAIIIHRPDPVVFRDGDTLIVTQSYDSYQWYLNGDSIEGGNSGQYVIEEGGYYVVEVIDSNGCVGSVEGFMSPVGIQEIVENDDRILIYPNPFSNSTTIAYDLGKECELGCEIQFYDIQGRIIMRQTLYTDNGKGSFVVDMSSYGNGIYYCALYGDKQLLQTEKLILMR